MRKRFHSCAGTRSEQTIQNDIQIAIAQGDGIEHKRKITYDRYSSYERMKRSGSPAAVQQIGNNRSDACCNADDPKYTVTDIAKD